METREEQSAHSRDRILVLSADGARQFTGAAEQLGWPVMENAAAGKALREINLSHPIGVVVLVESDPGVVQRTTSLIADLRKYQSQLPLVALAAEHDEAVEQRLRAAGATAYLAGDSASAAEAARLISAARPQPSERVNPPELVPRAGPPSARGAPAAAKNVHRAAPSPRIRGRPPSQRG